MQDIKGQIAWVTGAGSGIGEAAALALAEAGVHVVLTGRRSEPLETVAVAIRAKGGKAGGAARAKAMPSARRKEIAKAAAKAPVSPRKGG